MERDRSGAQWPVSAKLAHWRVVPRPGVVTARFRPIADLECHLHTRAMGTKLSAEDAGAYEALDRLLFRQWDPIGVSDMDGWAEDEYRAYLPRFWSMVTSGAPPSEIADYLGEIERERITMETSSEHRHDIAVKAAALLAAWKLPVRS